MSENPEPQQQVDVQVDVPHGSPSSTPNPDAASSSPGAGPGPSLERIQELLGAKNDTSRFVGLALLKSVLDNSAGLREDEAAVADLWGSISAKFLDRLLRTGTGRGGASSKDARDMLDLAVAVLHTFTVFLPERAKREPKLTGRVPMLVQAVLSSPEPTTQLILQTLLTLVSFPEGARVLAESEDLSPLTEIAPSQPLVLDVLEFAWLNAVAVVDDPDALSVRIDRSIQSLVASFKGTDAVTLLDFLAKLLRGLDARCLPPNPRWLEPVTGFIRNLVTSRPTAAGRAAYTNLAATLLQVYPAAAPRLLFSEGSGAGAGATPGASDRPFSYLLVSLLLVDLRSSFPALLAQLNSPGYAETARRLASAFDVVSAFVGFLVRSMDDDDDDDDDDTGADGAGASHVMMPPDLLLKLRKAVSEAMSVAVEFLRDRWDASVAGALGLHPEARAGSGADLGARLAIPWESKAAPAARDPLVLAAVRALALWLREDDNDALRREAAGLSDMLMDLYKGSGGGGGGGDGGVPSGGEGEQQQQQQQHLDFRLPVLVAVEGITAVDEGAEALLAEGMWEVLTQDMLAILRATSSSPSSSPTSSPPPPPPLLDAEAARGLEIVRALLPVAEAERPGPREPWMAVVIHVAAWDVPSDESSPVVRDFQAAVLQLVAALVAGAHPGMRRRYVHSIGAVVGIVQQLRRNAERAAAETDPGLLESLADVETTLNALR